MLCVRARAVGGHGCPARPQSTSNPAGYANGCARHEANADGCARHDASDCAPPAAALPQLLQLQAELPLMFV